MDYTDMVDSLRARDTAPLPAIPLRDLSHWRDPVPSCLDAKNEAALADYRVRASIAGVYRDPMSHTARVASGLEARRWVLGDVA